MDLISGEYLCLLLRWLRASPQSAASIPLLRGHLEPGWQLVLLLMTLLHLVDRLLLKCLLSRSVVELLLSPDPER